MSRRRRNLCGIVDGLQAGCKLGPAVVAEVGMGRACREHQKVIRKLPVAHSHNVPPALDAGDLAEQHPGVALPPDQTPDRPSDLCRG